MSGVSCIGLYLHYCLNSELNRPPSNMPLFITVATGEVVDILFFGLQKWSMFCLWDRRIRRYFVFRNEEAIDILLFRQKKPSLFCFSE